jgi:hypothetical protein
VEGAFPAVNILGRNISSFHVWLKSGAPRLKDNLIFILLFKRGGEIGSFV